MKAPVIKLSLNHPFVLYFVLVVAMTNLLYLAVTGKMGLAAIFLLVGFLTSFFSKNMTVILVIAIVTTSVLEFGSNAAISEGLENADDDKKKTDDVKPDVKPEPDVKPVDADAAIDKIADKQQALADKIAKLEPTLTQVENFMERLEKFSSYK